MTEPTNDAENVVDGNLSNPFISLKNILEDEECSSIAIGELVTAIEAHGIYTYDKFGRLFLCKIDSEQGRKVITLLLEFKFHDPDYNEEHGIQEYDPPPLDDIVNENFGKYPSELQTFRSQYNYYGWPEDKLPNFSAIDSKKIDEKPLGERERKGYIRTVSVLLKYIKGDMKGVKKHQDYVSDSQLILDIEAEYSKNSNSLSKRSLEQKFSDANDDGLFEE